MASDFGRWSDLEDLFRERFAPYLYPLIQKEEKEMSKPWDKLRAPAPLGTGRWTTANGAEVKVSEMGSDYVYLQIGSYPPQKFLQNDLKQLQEFVGELVSQVKPVPTYMTYMDYYPWLTR